VYLAGTRRPPSFNNRSLKVVPSFRLGEVLSTREQLREVIVKV
jgi:hypothetical protein